MNREEVKTIKIGQYIEFKYIPEGQVYNSEVLSVDKDGYNVHIQGIIKDKLFMVRHSEIIRVIDTDKETIKTQVG